LKGYHYIETVARKRWISFEFFEQGTMKYRGARIIAARIKNCPSGSWRQLLSYQFFEGFTR
jgi:hypothetical protein